MKFRDLELNKDLLDSLDKIGFLELTAIQEKVIPLILNGKDIAGLSQTGTGKTLAFLLPLMERVLQSECEPPGDRSFKNWKGQSSVLILVPTRELADQIGEEVHKLSSITKFRTAIIVGGNSYQTQIDEIKNNPHFIIGTPGRILDLYNQHYLDFRRVSCVVFDEADRMFDMGFKDDMNFILKRIPSDRQYLAFSATLNFDVQNIGYTYGAEPVEVNVSKDQAISQNVVDEIFHVGESEKPGFILSLFKKFTPKQSIVFCNYKHQVERIAQFLTKNGLPAVAISSLLTQNQRERVIEQFKGENSKNILVATDLAARGLDIMGVDLIINYDLPDDCETYVHRIGRTGRASNTGKAFSLVGENNVESLARIEEYLKKKLNAGWLEDADIIKDFIHLKTHEPRRDYEPRKDERPPRNFDNKDRGPRDYKENNTPRNNYVPRNNNGPRDNTVPRDNRPNHDGNRETNPRNNYNQNNVNENDGTHRDKRMGRHSGQDTVKPETNTRNTNQVPARQENRPKPQKPSYDKKVHTNKSASTQKRTFTRKSVPSKNANIAQKIVKFFKDIF